MPGMRHHRVLRGAVLAALLVFCLLGRVVPAGAWERIERFASFVDIQSDGSLLVREEISVKVEGREVRRGIYRDFPLRYSGPEKYRGHVPFTVLSTSLDGVETDPKDVEKRGDDIRIFIRSPELLSHGVHRFVLVYSTSLHVRHFAEYDELNWNVTGPRWGLSIYGFSCEIGTPEGVVIDQTAGWKGKTGSKDSEAVEIIRLAPNRVRFAGRRVGGFDPGILSGEQFTVAVNFPKGAVENPVGPYLAEQERLDAEREARLAAERKAALNAPPPYTPQGIWNRLQYYYARHHDWLLRQGVMLLLVCAYFGILWYRKGRDPAGGTVIPRFSPPMGEYMGKPPMPGDFVVAPMSPMAVEYLRSGKKDSDRGFAALFLSLAVHRLCGIRKDKDAYVLVPRADVTVDMARLAPEEWAVYTGLLEAAGEEGELKLTPHQKAVRSMKNKAVECLRRNYAASWALNSHYVVLGWLLVLPLAFGLSLVSLEEVLRFQEETGERLILTTMTAVFLGAGVYFFVNRMKLVCLMFMLPFTVTGVMGLYVQDLLNDFRWVAPLLMAVAATVFSILMKAPSREARKVLDEIEGLHMYMAAAEKDRLEMLNRPEETPQTFERLLPYALALWLEKTWCDRFADQIAAGLLTSGGIDVGGAHDAVVMTGFVEDFRSATRVSVAPEPSSSSSDDRSYSGSAFSSSGGGGGGGGGSGSGSGGGGGGGV